MMNDTVKLRTVIKQVRGVSYGQEDTSQSPAQGFIPLLRATNIKNNNLIDLNELIYVTQKRVNKEQYLQLGDILIAASSGSIEMVGKAATFEGDDKLTFGAFCKVIRPNKELVNPKYIGFFFETDYYKKRISFLAQGANIHNLRNEHIDELEIFLPDLETQNKIVAILDKAKSLIEKREETIALQEELLRATFVDMFLKYQGIRLLKLEEVADVVSGLTKGKNYIGKVTQFVPYMRVANVQDGFLDLNEVKEIEATDEEIKRYKLEYEDLLLTEGGDPDKLGRGTLWKNQVENCIYQNHIFRVRIKDKDEVNPTFLSYQMSSQYGKNYFLKAAKQTSGIASINSKQLKSFPVYIPPISLQNDFSLIVKKAEELSKKLNESKQDIIDLFRVLSQLAFNGQLSFNTAADLEVLLENDYTFFKKNSSLQTIQLLLERLDKHESNKKKFYEKEVYEKAKGFAFELLKEGKIKQVFDVTTKLVKLAVQ